MSLRPDAAWLETARGAWGTVSRRCAADGLGKASAFPAKRSRNPRLGKVTRGGRVETHGRRSRFSELAAESAPGPMVRSEIDVAELAPITLLVSQQ